MWWERLGIAINKYFSNLPVEFARQCVRQFIACKGNALQAKSLYRSLALVHHLDKGGTKEAFQTIEDVYNIAKKGRGGLRELRARIPKKICIQSDSADLLHPDKLDVFDRATKTVNGKPLYVKRNDPTIAVWWAPADTYYPSGMWLLGRYDKRGQDCAYHIMAAREKCLEEYSDLNATQARRCETFCASSEAFQGVSIAIEVEDD